MPNEPQPPPAAKGPVAKADAAQDERIAKRIKELFTEERIMQWYEGQMTLAELSGTTQEEMLDMAMAAFALYEQGRYDESLVVFKALVDLDPKQSYYRTATGAVYLAQQKLDDALKLFTEAIELNDKEIASFINRGEVFLRLGRIPDAAKDFKRVVELDPKNKDPLTQRAQLLANAALQAIEAKEKGGKPAQAAPSGAKASSGAKGGKPSKKK